MLALQDLYSFLTLYHSSVKILSLMESGKGLVVIFVVELNKLTTKMSFLPIAQCIKMCHLADNFHYIQGSAKTMEIFKSYKSVDGHWGFKLWPAD